LREEPEYELDDIAFPNDVVAFFRGVKSRVAAERHRLEEEERAREAARRRRATERAEHERARVARLEELARQQLVEHEASRLIATIPFGIGQFQNADTGLGWFFLVLEGSLAITSIVTSLIHFVQLNFVLENVKMGVTGSLDIDEAAALADAMMYTNWITLGVLGASVIAGIVEAHVSFAPTRLETRERELPPELRPEPDDDGDDERVEPALIDPMQPPPSNRPKVALSLFPFGLGLRLEL
jgi:hypothetical protein